MGVGEMDEKESIESRRMGFRAFKRERSVSGE